MNEKQKREKLNKLKAQVKELEDELPEEVETRGDPIVRFK